MHSASALANYYMIGIIPYIDSCTYFLLNLTLDHPMFQDSMRMDIPSLDWCQTIAHKNNTTQSKILSQNTDLEFGSYRSYIAHDADQFYLGTFLHAGERLPDLNLWNYAKSKIKSWMESNAQRQAEIFKNAYSVQVQIDPNFKGSAEPSF